MLPVAVFLNNLNENQGGALADADIISGAAHSNHPFTLFGNIDNMDMASDTPSTIDVESALYNGFLPLFLDTFRIEDGQGKYSPAEKGMYWTTYYC